MLQANKGKVLTGFHQTSLEIRQCELKYFTTVFEQLSGASSMLAGFASSILMLEVPRRDSAVLQTVFLVSGGCAFGFNLLVILISTLCCLWGPGRALFGNDGSHAVAEAIEVLAGAQQTAMRFFLLGLLSYFLASITLAWIFYDFFSCLLVTGFLSLFCFLLLRQISFIRRVFLADTGAASGVASAAGPDTADTATGTASAGEASTGSAVAQGLWAECQSVGLVGGDMLGSHEADLTAGMGAAHSGTGVMRGNPVQAGSRAFNPVLTGANSFNPEHELGVYTDNFA
eukprot:gene314-67_t